MAAPADNFSLGDFISTERNAKQKEQGVTKSFKSSMMFSSKFPTTSRGHLEMHLQQQWQELKERECIAQQHNRQLLQQFEEAQDMLKEMLARNAAMKTIRIEYKRYLEKNISCWQQQLQTEAAEKRKMEEYLTSYLKKTEEQSSKPADGHTLPKGTSIKPKRNAPQSCSHEEYSDYNTNRSFQNPYISSPWLTHPQSKSGSFPVRVAAQIYNPSVISSPGFPHHHPFIPPFASVGDLHHPLPRQEAPYWNPSEHRYPWPLVTGATNIQPEPWGHFYTQTPHLESMILQTGKQGDEMIKAENSKWKQSGSSSSDFPPELDVRPVRLPSAPAESSESCRESHVSPSQEKKKKKTRQHSSSESERCALQELSKEVVASAAVAQSSVTEISTDDENSQCSKMSKKSQSVSAGLETFVKAANEPTKNPNDDIQSSAEESEHSSNDPMKKKTENKKHESNKEMEIEKQDSSTELSSAEENKESGKQETRENDQGEDSDINESDEEGLCSETNKTEKVVETTREEDDDDEESNLMENNDGEFRKQSAASSQDKENNESEGSEGKMDDEESNEEEMESEEEKMVEKDEEDTDSEDSIISPQRKRSEQVEIISEHAAEQDEEGEDDSSSEDSDEDDVENLLAPPDQSKTEKKDEKIDHRPKVIRDIFQVKSKTDHPSDSDDFANFYD